MRSAINLQTFSLIPQYYRFAIEEIVTGLTKNLLEDAIGNVVR